MENRQKQILSEIQEMMSSIRTQLEKLDVKIAEFQQVADVEGVSAAPIDLEIDESYFIEETVVEGYLDIEDVEAEPETEFVEEVKPEAVIVPEVVTEVQVETDQESADVFDVETVPAAVTETETETETEVDTETEIAEEVEVTVEEEDLPLFAEPESIFEVAQKAPKATRAVIDVMEDKQAWRTDMPGTPVKDLLSAISLNDRVQFINVLFNEDPAAFQQARARINMMETLDEVVEYVTAEFDWDMNSQVVYRFMMAVRRKVK